MIGEGDVRFRCSSMVPHHQGVIVSAHRECRDTMSLSNLFGRVISSKLVDIVIALLPHRSQ